MQRSSRAWIDQLVVTPASRARTVDRLQRQHGPAVDWSGNQDRYRSARNGAVAEEVFDRSIGAVLRQSVTTHEGILVRTAKEFVAGGGGRYVLRRVVTEYPRGGATTRLVQEFNNLQIEARAQ
jgi:hypothetical protein